MSAGEEMLAIQLRAAGIPFEREYRFLGSARRYRADFAMPMHMLLVEVQGGAWIAGRHTRGSGYAADLVRQNLAQLAGWKILQYVPAQIKSGEAITQIEMAIGANG